MEVKLCLIFLLLAFAVMAEASSFHGASWGLDNLSRGLVGDFIGEDNEMLMDSEASRRALAGQKKYISYSALKKNQVPCGRRGQSYYNCQKRQRANPYKRGCTVITHCARFTD